MKTIPAHTIKNWLMTLEKADAALDAMRRNWTDPMPYDTWRLSTYVSLGNMRAELMDYVVTDVQVNE